MPSTMASVLKRTNRSGTPRSSTAQSSPAPVTTLSLPGREWVSRRMSSSSFIFLQLFPPFGYLVAIKIAEEVHGVKEGVGEDWGCQRARVVVEQGENDGEGGERQKGRGAAMNDGKQ